MHRNRHFVSGAARMALLCLTLIPGSWISAQTPASRSAAASPANTSDEDREAMRDRLFKLLRLSPKLTAVLSRDPSLLADQEYVARNNPELAQFLQQHPEIVRNPEFYLYANGAGRGNPGMRLEEYVWPESYLYRTSRAWDYIIPFLVFVFILSALLWLFRVLLENRRWNRILKLQSDVHGKLLDKFGSSQELLTYMNTEAGKRFLEAGPMPVAADLISAGRMSLSRILTPLQLGVVLFLIGAVSFSLQSIPGGETAFHILAMLGLALGIGFIISAGLAYLMAKHLDLLPQRGADLEKKALTAKEQL
ncbi:MAG TPA: hypothetical protein VJA94_12035 [Candidatus Angelobacter sp.]